MPESKIKPLATVHLGLSLPADYNTKKALLVPVTDIVGIFCVFCMATSITATYMSTSIAGIDRDRVIGYPAQAIVLHFKSITYNRSYNWKVW